MKDEETAKTSKLMSIADAKSLYDAMVKEASAAKDKRVARELCICRETMDKLLGVVRWIPHVLNPVDCMSKLKGNMASMLKFMRENSFILVEENVELEKRQAAKASGKRVLRTSRRIKIMYQSEISDEDDISLCDAERNVSKLSGQSINLAELS